MAVIFSTFFKKLKGKIDHLILYESRGQMRLRSSGNPVISPRSPEQQLQQKRLRAAVAFYRANRNTRFVQIWRIAAQNKVMSGYNYFLHSNIAVFNEDHRISDYSMLQISCGSLELPPCLKVADYWRGHLQLTWQNSLPESSSHMYDRLYLFWLNERGSFSLQAPKLPIILRKDEEATLSLPEAGEENMHLYFYFSNQQETCFSPAKYIYLKAL